MLCAFVYCRFESDSFSNDRTDASQTHVKFSGRLRAPRTLLVLLFWLTVGGTSVLAEDPECLTGKFTDVQRWVNVDGTLSDNINPVHKLDLTGKPDFLAELRLLMKEETAEYDNYVFLRGHGNPKKIEPVAEDDFHISYPTIFSIKEKGDVALKNVYFLSLARNSLERIPLFYTDSNGVSGSYWKHLKYLSLYGNIFSGDSTKLSQSLIEYAVTLNATDWEEVTPQYYFSYPKGKSNWAKDLSRLDFSSLLELDLRNCSIEILDDRTFENLSNLRRLYLSHNNIHHAYAGAFAGLSKLVHLDLSKNLVKIKDTSGIVDGIMVLPGAFVPLIGLKSLDFSHSKIAQTSSGVFAELGPSVERLSICYTKFPYVRRGAFDRTSMKHLDISGNLALETLDQYAFYGIEDSLEVLYAQRLGIKNMKPFEDLCKLKVLSLADNDINAVDSRSLRNLRSLKIVDLSDNRITNWNERTLIHQPELEFLKLNRNNLNLLSLEMLTDFNDLRFLSLSDNNFVCNCYVKCFIDGAAENEDSGRLPSWYANETDDDDVEFEDPKNETFYISLSEVINFHNAFIYFSSLIDKRNKNSTSASYSVRDNHCQNGDLEEAENFSFARNFTFQLLDDEGEYMCIDSRSNKAEYFSNVTDCDESKRGQHPPADMVASSSALVIALIAVATVVSAVVIVVWKWWYVRYFFLMMKNVAILTVLGKESNPEAGDKMFNYDVFVSYCEHDRGWVLDHFLPNVENNSDLSVCLHERDFQVGLSILENIISCMDRSRTLLMVLSEKFLQSRWCQFEMHLAQHRLVETRREQLILVLLEDIPKRKRPNTLNYLMLTKTYIIWPKSKSDIPAFWKRLKRSIVLHSKSNTDSAA